MENMGIFSNIGAFFNGGQDKSNSSEELQKYFMHTANLPTTDLQRLARGLQKMDDRKIARKVVKMLAEPSVARAQKIRNLAFSIYLMENQDGVREMLDHLLSLNCGVLELYNSILVLRSLNTAADFQSLFQWICKEAYDLKIICMVAVLLIVAVSAVDPPTRPSCEGLAHSKLFSYCKEWMREWGQEIGLVVWQDFGEVLSKEFDVFPLAPDKGSVADFLKPLLKSDVDIEFKKVAIARLLCRCSAKYVYRFFDNFRELAVSTPKLYRLFFISVAVAWTSLFGDQQGNADSVKLLTTTFTKFEPDERTKVQLARFLSLKQVDVKVVEQWILNNFSDKVKLLNFGLWNSFFAEMGVAALKSQPTLCNAVIMGVLFLQRHNNNDVDPSNDWLVELLQSQWVGCSMELLAFLAGTLAARFPVIRANNYFATLQHLHNNFMRTDFKFADVEAFVRLNSEHHFMTLHRLPLFFSQLVGEPMKVDHLDKHLLEDAYCTVNEKPTLLFALWVMWLDGCSFFSRAEQLHRLRCLVQFLHRVTEEKSISTNALTSCRLSVRLLLDRLCVLLVRLVDDNALLLKERMMPTIPSVTEYLHLPKELDNILLSSKANLDPTKISLQDCPSLVEKLEIVAYFNHKPEEARTLQYDVKNSQECCIKQKEEILASSTLLVWLMSVLADVDPKKHVQLRIELLKEINNLRDRILDTISLANLSENNMNHLVFLEKWLVNDRPLFLALTPSVLMFHFTRKLLREQDSKQAFSSVKSQLIAFLKAEVQEKVERIDNLNVEKETALMSKAFPQLVGACNVGVALKKHKILSELDNIKKVLGKIIPDDAKAEYFVPLYQLSDVQLDIMSYLSRCPQLLALAVEIASKHSAAKTIKERFNALEAQIESILKDMGNEARQDEALTLLISFKAFIWPLIVIVVRTGDNTKFDDVALNMKTVAHPKEIGTLEGRLQELEERVAVIREVVETGQCVSQTAKILKHVVKLFDPQLQAKYCVCSQRNQLVSKIVIDQGDIQLKSYFSQAGDLDRFLDQVTVAVEGSDILEGSILLRIRGELEAAEKAFGKLCTLAHPTYLHFSAQWPLCRNESTVDVAKKFCSDTQKDLREWECELSKIVMNPKDVSFFLPKHHRSALMENFCANTVAQVGQLVPTLKVPEQQKKNISMGELSVCLCLSNPQDVLLKISRHNLEILDFRLHRGNDKPVASYQDALRYALSRYNDLKRPLYWFELFFVNSWTTAFDVEQLCRVITLCPVSKISVVVCSNVSMTILDCLALGLNAVVCRSGSSYDILLCCEVSLLYFSHLNAKICNKIPTPLVVSLGLEKRNIFFVGPPGCGKSHEMRRQLAVKGGSRVLAIHDDVNEDVFYQFVEALKPNEVAAITIDSAAIETQHGDHNSCQSGTFAAFLMLLHLVVLRIVKNSVGGIVSVPAGCIFLIEIPMTDAEFRIQFPVVADTGDVQNLDLGVDNCVGKLASRWDDRDSINFIVSVVNVLNGTGTMLVDGTKKFDRRSEHFWNVGEANKHLFPIRPTNEVMLNKMCVMVPKHVSNFYSFGCWISLMKKRYEVVYSVYWPDMILGDIQTKVGAVAKEMDCFLKDLVLDQVNRFVNPKNELVDDQVLVLPTTTHVHLHIPANQVKVATDYQRLVAVLFKELVEKDSVRLVAEVVVASSTETSISEVRKVFQRRNFIVVGDFLPRALAVTERLRASTPLVISSETGIGKTFLLETLGESIFCNFVRLVHSDFQEKFKALLSKPIDTDNNRVQFLKDLEQCQKKLSSMIIWPQIPDKDSAKFAEFVGALSAIKLDQSKLQFRPCFYKIVVHPALKVEEVETMLREANESARRIKKDVHDNVEGSNQLNKDLAKIIVFFDELNTSSIPGYLKALITDRRTDDGLKVEDNVLFFAAINPAREREEEAEKNKKKNTVGYYLVSAIHPSLKFLQQHFCEMKSLEKYTEAALSNTKFFPDDVLVAYSKFICAVHIKISSDKKAGAISQRDLQRSIHISIILLKLFGYSKAPSTPSKCLMQAVYLCYVARLPLGQYRDEALKYLDSSAISFLLLQDCTKERLGMLNQLVNHENFDLKQGVALTSSLKENILLNLISAVSEKPKLAIAIIGASGRGKTLSQRIVEQNMRGKRSLKNFFKNFPPLTMSYLQGSVSTTAEQVSVLLSQTISRQLQDTAVHFSVCFDEAGLPLHSKNVLKAAHDPLDSGSIAFVCLSNQPFDDANQNRMLTALRQDESREDICCLVYGCLGVDQQVEGSEFHKQVNGLTNAFLKLSSDEKYTKKFQSREFIYLLRHICLTCETRRTKNIIPFELLVGIEYNYGSRDKDDITNVAKIFVEEMKLVQPHSIAWTMNWQPRPVAEVLQASLSRDVANPFLRPRFKLIIDPTDDYSASQGLVTSLAGWNDKSPVETMVVSNFPSDVTPANDAKLAAKLRLFMEKGRHVIIFNPDRLLGALFDVLNLNYSTHFDSDGIVHYKAMTAIGAETHLCEVHDNFRVTFVLRRDVVEQMEKTLAPFLSRVEKYLATIPQSPSNMEPSIEAFVKTVGATNFSGFQQKLSIPFLFQGHRDNLPFVFPQEVHNIPEDIRKIFQLNVALTSLVPLQSMIRAMSKLNRGMEYMKCYLQEQEHFNLHSLMEIEDKRRGTMLFISTTDVSGLAQLRESSLSIAFLSDRGLGSIRQLELELQLASKRPMPCTAVVVVVEERGWDVDYINLVRACVSQWSQHSQKYHAIVLMAPHALPTIFSRSYRHIYMDTLNTSEEALVSLKQPFEVHHKGQSSQRYFLQAAIDQLFLTHGKGTIGPVDRVNHKWALFYKHDTPIKDKIKIFEDVLTTHKEIGEALQVATASALEKDEILTLMKQQAVENEQEGLFVAKLLGKLHKKVEDAVQRSVLMLISNCALLSLENKWINIQVQLWQQSVTLDFVQLRAVPSCALNPWLYLMLRGALPVPLPVNDSHHQIVLQQEPRFRMNLGEAFVRVEPMMTDALFDSFTSDALVELGVLQPALQNRPTSILATLHSRLSQFEKQLPAGGKLTWAHKLLWVMIISAVPSTWEGILVDCLWLTVGRMVQDDCSEFTVGAILDLFRKLGTCSASSMTAFGVLSSFALRSPQSFAKLNGSQRQTCAAFTAVQFLVASNGVKYNPDAVLVKAMLKKMLSINAENGSLSNIISFVISLDELERVFLLPRMLMWYLSVGVLRGVKGQEVSLKIAFDRICSTLDLMNHFSIPCLTTLTSMIQSFHVGEMDVVATAYHCAFNFVRLKSVHLGFPESPLLVFESDALTQCAFRCMVGTWAITTFKSTEAIVQQLWNAISEKLKTENNAFFKKIAVVALRYSFLVQVAQLVSSDRFKELPTFNDCFSDFLDSSALWQQVFCSIVIKQFGFDKIQLVMNRMLQFNVGVTKYDWCRGYLGKDDQLQFLGTLRSIAMLPRFPISVSCGEKRLQEQFVGIRSAFMKGTRKFGVPQGMVRKEFLFIFFHFLRSEIFLADKNAARELIAADGDAPQVDCPGWTPLHTNFVRYLMNPHDWVTKVGQVVKLNVGAPPHRLNISTSNFIATFVPPEEGHTNSDSLPIYCMVSLVLCRLLAEYEGKIVNHWEQLLVEPKELKGKICFTDLYSERLIHGFDCGALFDDLTGESTSCKRPTGLKSNMHKYTAFATLYTTLLGCALMIPEKVASWNEHVVTNSALSEFNPNTMMFLGGLECNMIYFCCLQVSQQTRFASSLLQSSERQLVFFDDIFSTFHEKEFAPHYSSVSARLTAEEKFSQKVDCSFGAIDMELAKISTLRNDAGLLKQAVDAQAKLPALCLVVQKPANELFGGMDDAIQCGRRDFPFTKGFVKILAFYRLLHLNLIGLLETKNISEPLTVIVDRFKLDCNVINHGMDAFNELLEKNNFRLDVECGGQDFGRVTMNLPLFHFISKEATSSPNDDGVLLIALDFMLKKSRTFAQELKPALNKHKPSNFNVLQSCLKVPLVRCAVSFAACSGCSVLDPEFAVPLNDITAAAANDTDLLCDYLTVCFLLPLEQLSLTSIDLRIQFRSKPPSELKAIAPEERDTALDEWAMGRTQPVSLAKVFESHNYSLVQLKQFIRAAEVLAIQMILTDATKEKLDASLSETLSPDAAPLGQALPPDVLVRDLKFFILAAQNKCNAVDKEYFFNDAKSRFPAVAMHNRVPEADAHKAIQLLTTEIVKIQLSKNFRLLEDELSRLDTIIQSMLQIRMIQKPIDTSLEEILNYTLDDMDSAPFSCFKLAHVAQAYSIVREAMCSATAFQAKHEAEDRKCPGKCELYSEGLTDHRWSTVVKKKEDVKKVEMQRQDSDSMQDHSDSFVLLPQAEESERRTFDVDYPISNPIFLSECPVKSELLLHVKYAVWNRSGCEVNNLPTSDETTEIAKNHVRIWYRVGALWNFQDQPECLDEDGKLTPWSTYMVLRRCARPQLFCLCDISGVVLGNDNGPQLDSRISKHAILVPKKAEVVSKTLTNVDVATCTIKALCTSTVSDVCQFLVKFLNCGTTGRTELVLFTNETLSVTNPYSRWKDVPSVASFSVGLKPLQLSYKTTVVIVPSHVTNTAALKMLKLSGMRLSGWDDDRRLDSEEWSETDRALAVEKCEKIAQISITVGVSDSKAPLSFTLRVGVTAGVRTVLEAFFSSEANKRYSNIPNLILVGENGQEVASFRDQGRYTICSQWLTPWRLTKSSNANGVAKINCKCITPTAETLLASWAAAPKNFKGALVSLHNMKRVTPDEELQLTHAYFIVMASPDLCSLDTPVHDDNAFLHVSIDGKQSGQYLADAPVSVFGDKALFWQGLSLASLGTARLCDIHRAAGPIAVSSKVSQRQTTTFAFQNCDSFDSVSVQWDAGHSNCDVLKHVLPLLRLWDKDKTHIYSFTERYAESLALDYSCPIIQVNLEAPVAVELVDVGESPVDVFSARKDILSNVLFAAGRSLGLSSAATIPPHAFVTKSCAWVRKSDVAVLLLKQKFALEGGDPTCVTVNQDFQVDGTKDKIVALFYSFGLLR